MTDTKFRDPLIWKRFGIHHLSPAHLNSYLCYNSDWIMNYGYKYNFMANLPMIIGSVVEPTGTLFAEQRPNNPDTVYSYAEALFDAKVEKKDKDGVILPQTEEEKEKRKTLRPLVDKVIDVVQKSGNYKGTQKKVVISLSEMFGDEDLPNMIGYTDYDFEKDRFPLTVDIKVPKNKSSEMSFGYWLQGMFYYHGQDYNKEKGDVEFHQILSRKSTDRKTKKVTYSADTNKFSIREYMEEHPDEDWKERLYSVISSMKATLSRCQTWQEVAEMHPPNPDDYFWKMKKNLTQEKRYGGSNERC